MRASCTSREHIATQRAIRNSPWPRAIVDAGPQLQAAEALMLRRRLKGPRRPETRSAHSFWDGLHWRVHRKSSLSYSVHGRRVQLGRSADRLPLEWCSSSSDSALSSLLHPPPPTLAFLLTASLVPPSPPPAGHDTLFFERAPYAVRYPLLPVFRRCVHFTSNSLGSGSRPFLHLSCLTRLRGCIIPTILRPNTLSEQTQSASTLKRCSHIWSC